VASGAHFNWVRPGIVLYGASPSGLWQDMANTGLKPVMTLRSEIIAVQNLKAGEAVGYGATWRTAEERRIGIVACGYADGYPRLAPSGTPVLVDGVRTTTVGRISMDMLAVDLTPVRRPGSARRSSCGAKRSKSTMSRPPAAPSDMS
jgi:alanine racemase